MEIKNVYEYFYYLPTEELTKLIYNAKSDEEKRFYYIIENYISKVQQKKVMEEESYE